MDRLERNEFRSTIPVSEENERVQVGGIVLCGGKSSRMGLPISTTHTLVGAIIGVGLARGLTALDTRTLKSVFASWLITVPFVAILCMAIYKGVSIFVI